METAHFRKSALCFQPFEGRSVCRRAQLPQSPSVLSSALPDYALASSAVCFQNTHVVIERVGPLDVKRGRGELFRPPRNDGGATQRIQPSTEDWCSRPTRSKPGGGPAPQSRLRSTYS